MKELKVNHLASWVAITLIVIFLYVWYNYFFFDEWLRVNGVNATEFNTTRSFVPYAFSFLSTVLIVYVLAWIFAGLKVDDFRSGIAVALSIGFTFTFLNVLVKDQYLFRPLEISLIDGGANLFACIIAGAILGGWGNRSAG